MTTTAPRAMPRTPHSVVELLQAGPEPGAAGPVAATDPAADARAASGSRRASSRVMRVRRVPMVNTSTRPARRDATAAWAKRASPRA